MVLPVLFLDVDGVLNLYAADGSRSDLVEHALFPGEEPVRVDPAHGGLVRRLAAAFDVVWATAWNENANELLAPLLGIPPLPVVAMPRVAFQPRDKLGPIDEHAGARPAVWIDDLHTLEARDWAARRASPTLLIPSDPGVGLTPAMVDRALRWAAALPEIRDGAAGR